MQLPAALPGRTAAVTTPIPPLNQSQVNHADTVHEDLLRFNRLWLAECAPDSLLVFSTGRSPELFRELAVGGADAFFGGRWDKCWREGARWA